MLLLKNFVLRIYKWAHMEGTLLLKHNALCSAEQIFSRNVEVIILSYYYNLIIIILLLLSF